MAINNYNDPLPKPYYQAEVIPEDDDDKGEPLFKELVLTDWILGGKFSIDLDLKKIDAIQYERIDKLMREAIAERGFYILGIAVTQPTERESGFYHYDGNSLKERIKDTFKDIESQQILHQALFIRVDGLNGNYDYIGSETAMFNNTAVSALFNIYLNIEEKLPKAYYDLACCYEQKNKSSKLSPEQKSHYLNQQMHYFKLAADSGYPEAYNKLAAVYIQAAQFENAITYLEKAIEQGSADANYVLAKLYFEKIPAQREKCLPLFETVLKLNDKPPARLFYYIGTCYFNGIGTAIDLQKALEMLEEASKANVPEAKHELGLFYLSKADYPKASEYLSVAAKLGNIESEFRFALMHFNGQCEPKSGCFAIFKALAQKSHFPKAYFYLAYCYEQGIGCEKSPKDAKTYYEQAAKHNDPKALYRLEIEKLDGAQRDKEYAQAQKLFTKNIDENERNSRAFFFLAKKTQNHKEAIAYYKESAKLGYAPAMYIVGKAYYEGSYGLAKSLDDAECILLKAKSHENVPYLLAKIYEEKKEFKKALEIYKSKNHPEYLFRLYQIYTDGLCNVEKSEQAGLNYLKQAANKGHLEAKSILEEMAKNERPFKKWENWENYFDADGILYNCDIPKDLLPKIRESAQRGRVQDQYNLALLYIQGSATIPIDNHEGQTWLKLALKQDFALAFLLQGKMFEHSDQLNALKYLLKAVPHPEAFLRLYYLHAKSNEDVKNPNKSLQCLEKAYQAGYPDAIYSMARRLLGQKKIKEGLDLLNEAKNKGCPKSTFWLAESYRTDKFGLGLNPKKAFSLFLEGANRNQYVSIYMAARCYQEGIGVKKSKENANKLLAKLNTSDAHKLYLLASFLGGSKSDLIEVESVKKFLTKAAELGHVQAMVELGNQFETGTTFELNPQKALEWWKRAVDLGDGFALLQVAGAYDKGIGTNPDAIKAKEFYLKAADKDIADAITFVGYYYETGLCQFERNQQIATEYYKKAADQGHTMAMVNLGSIWIRDQSHVDEGLEWLKKAADNNNGKACFELGEFFQRGDGDHPINIDESIKFYEKGLALNDDFCAYQLALIYGNGLGGQQKDYELAKKYLAKAVEKLDPKAMCKLGLLLFYGQWGYPINQKDAFHYFTLAVSKGDIQAHVRVAICYYSGAGVQKDMQQAKIWFEKAANMNDAHGCLGLGECYFEGAGVVKDQKEAFKWFKKGSDLGDNDSCYYVARYYLEGLGGVNVDIEAGKEMLLKAVEKRSAPAHWKLAEFYRKGLFGFLKDLTKSKHHYREAAELGYDDAMLDLAKTIYEESEYEDEVDEAINWFKKALGKGKTEAYYDLGKIYLEQGNMEAGFNSFEAGAKLNLINCIYQLGLLYGQGFNEKPANFELANQYLSKAAAAGYLQAFLSIGYNHLYGEWGNEIDYPKAFELLSKAAANGLTEAMGLLGIMYRDGLGVKEDPEVSFAWFQKGALQDDSNCIYHLGYYYEKGIGTPINFELAKSNYLKAANTKDIEAMEKVASCLYEGSLGFEKDPREGFQWILKAAEMGSSISIYNMGINYLLGYGVEKDGAKALEYFREAQSRQPLAFFHLGVSYLTGLPNVEKNIEEGLMFLRKGAALKEPNCLIELARIFLSGELGVPADIELGKKYFFEALETEHRDAYYFAGNVYKDGLFGFEKDEAKGLEFWTKSADKGHKLAKERLGLSASALEKEEPFTRKPEVAL